MVRRIMVTAAVGLLFASAQIAVAKQEAMSPRVAAVRYALDQGWQIPRTNIVVLTETHLGVVDGHPVVQSAADRQRETALIAKLLGPGAKVGEAKDYLSCRVRWACVTSTDNYVLAVGGLFKGETDSRIVLFVPSSRNSGTEAQTSAIVDLSQRGATDWIGSRYTVEPRTIILRR